MTDNKDNNPTTSPIKLCKRFRGFLPVVVDVETGGFNPKTDALLEIAAIIIEMDEDGLLHLGKTHAYHVQPFPNANMDPASLEVNRIDPYHPFRFAIEEKEALEKIFKPIRKTLKNTQCQRAVLVGHNATFDLSFVQAAIKRCDLKHNPFHRFTTFDTATLAALACGQTTLARAAKAMDIPFDQNEAHSAIYDTECTAQLFCKIVNQWQLLSEKNP